MQKTTQLYEGKAKKVYATDDENLVIVDYKDDATAFNGLKKGTISGKGVINNRVTNYLMQLLEKNGVPTHFVKELSERETLVKKVSVLQSATVLRKALFLKSQQLNSHTKTTISAIRLSTLTMLLLSSLLQRMRLKL